MSMPSIPCRGSREWVSRQSRPTAQAHTGKYIVVKVLRKYYITFWHFCIQNALPLYLLLAVGRTVCLFVYLVMTEAPGVRATIPP